MPSALLEMILNAALILAPHTEFVASAGKNIDGRDLNSPQCLAVNQRTEEFLVSDALNNRVVIFDTLGAVVFVFSLGDNRVNPFGIAVNSSDEIIIGSMDMPILWIFDYAGEFIGEIALADTVLPGRILTVEDDELLVVNRAGNGYLGIDRSGRVLKQYGTNAVPCRPSSISIDGRGIIMVSVEGNAMTGFGAHGEIEYTFGVHGREPRDFSHPTAAIKDSLGWFWVIDSFRHHIKLFNSERMFVETIGQRGLGPGEFYFPVDLKITPHGKLGVLDKGSGRLQIFKILYDEE